jgi:hypothetical protein
VKKSSNDIDDPSMAAGSEILTSSSTHQEHERFQDLLRDGDPESSVERRTAVLHGWCGASDDTATCAADGSPTVDMERMLAQG